MYGHSYTTAPSTIEIFEAVPRRGSKGWTLHVRFVDSNMNSVAIIYLSLLLNIIRITYFFFLEKKNAFFAFLPSLVLSQLLNSSFWSWQKLLFRVEAEIISCIPPSSTKINSGHIDITSIDPCSSKIRVYINKDIFYPFKVVAHVISICTNKVNWGLKGSVFEVNSINIKYSTRWGSHGTGTVIWVPHSLRSSYAWRWLETWVSSA